MSKLDEINGKMTRALGVWAKRKGIRPVDFEDAMGWSYSHAWRVLHAQDPFTSSAYGAFIAAYGVEALNELFRIAGIDKKSIQEDT